MQVIQLLMQVLLLTWIWRDPVQCSSLIEFGKYLYPWREDIRLLPSIIYIYTVF
jgi:hypothetical protein